MLRASEADCRNYHGLCQNKAACAEKDGGRNVMPAVGWLITATSDEYDSEIYPLCFLRSGLQRRQGRILSTGASRSSRNGTIGH